MKNIVTLFLIELKKLYRTKVVAIILAIFIFMPIMLGLFAFIAKNPEAIGSTGLISMKASMFSSNDWQGYIIVLLQAGAGLGMVGVGFIYAYIFGREYNDKTLKDLLALPVSRSAIVSSKFLVGFVLSILLFTVMYVTGIVAGFIAGVSGDNGLIISMSKGFALQAILTILVSFPVAFFACYGKGVMAPLGYVIITVIIANLIATIGLGPVCPWAVPGLAGMNSSEPELQVKLIGYFILLLTVAAGFYFTIIFWLKADHQ